MAKTGVLLVNLGTPDSPETPDVRKYLRQFLMDGRVIDIPFIPRFLLVNGIIAPFRAPKSAKVYKELWTAEGSPLMVYGVKTKELLQEALGNEYVVGLAMRYQNPSIQSVIGEMRIHTLARLIIIPLFPQYASATSGSVVEEVMEVLKKQQLFPELVFKGPYYNHPLLIKAFAERAREKMKEREYDFYLFSYHGLPERQIHKGDPDNVCKLGDCCNQITESNQYCYRANCFETTRQIVNQLRIPENKYQVVFQSRLGKDPWIKPYADETIRSLAGKGYKNVLTFVPSFVADCLETTIEVGEEYKELFQEHGGESWEMVTGLNDHPYWIETLKHIVEN